MVTACAARRPTETARTSTKSSTSGNDEVDEAAIGVDAVQPHADAIADVEAALAAHDASLHRRRCDADVGAFVRRAGDQPVERLADTRFDEHRRCRFSYL